MSWKPAPWLAAAGRKPSFGPGRVRERRGLRQVGQSRSHLLRMYAERRRLFLAEHCWCDVCCRGRASEVHHARGRAGKLLLDTRYWLAVCRRCHRWIHDNPKAAQFQGWLAPRGQWGKADA